MLNLQVAGLKVKWAKPSMTLPLQPLLGLCTRNKTFSCNLPILGLDAHLSFVLWQPNPHKTLFT